MIKTFPYEEIRLYAPHHRRRPGRPLLPGLLDGLRHHAEPRQCGAAQATIFDKFERVLPAGGGKGQKIAGFGLGLSYVMNVVREHGGYVTVESVEGKFSEFTLSLPLPDEGPEADAREG